MDQGNPIAPARSRRRVNQSVTAMMLAAGGCALILAGSPEARADECDVIAARIAAAVSAEVKERTPANIFLMDHPLLGGLSLSCPSRNDKGRVVLPAAITFEEDTAYPGGAFYALVGQIGEIVTGVPHGRIERGAMRCQQAALNSWTDGDELKYRRVSFACHASARSGATTITLHR